LAITEEILDEIARVLSTKFCVGAEDARDMRDEISGFTKLIATAEAFDVVKTDPTDNWRARSPLVRKQHHRRSTPDGAGDVPGNQHDDGQRLPRPGQRPIPRPPQPSAGQSSSAFALSASKGSLIDAF
jgi:hypothetical protein